VPQRGGKILMKQCAVKRADNDRAGQSLRAVALGELCSQIDVYGRCQLLFVIFGGQRVTGSFGVAT